MMELDKVQLGAYCGSVAPINLSISSGQAVCVVGKSGSGKTSLLETLCGIRPWVGGSFRIHGEEMSERVPAERGVGLVPQDTVLFPGMRVEGQIGFPLQARGWKKAQQVERVEALLELLEITHLKGKSPKELSGGEGKRVVLARALSFQPSLLCLDEVTAGLDEETARVILTAVRSIMEVEQCVVLSVTHHKEEASVLGGTLVQLCSEGLKEIENPISHME